MLSKNSTRHEELFDAAIIDIAELMSMLLCDRSKHAVI